MKKPQNYDAWTDVNVSVYYQSCKISSVFVISQLHFTQSLDLGLNSVFGQFILSIKKTEVKHHTSRVRSQNTQFTLRTKQRKGQDK